MDDKAGSGFGLAEKKRLEDHNVNEDHSDSVQDVVDLSKKQQHNQQGTKIE